MTVTRQMIATFEHRYQPRAAEPFEVEELAAITKYNQTVEPFETLLDVDGFEDAVGIRDHFEFLRRCWTALDDLYVDLALGADHYHSPAAVRLLTYEASRYMANLNYGRRIALQALIGDAGPVPEIDDQGRMTFMEDDTSTRIPLLGTAADAGS